MKKGKTLPPVEQKDVFSRYKLQKMHQYLFSGIFAFVIAFSLVSAREGVDVRHFLANVAEVQNVQSPLSADIVARLSVTGTIDIIVGNTLEAPKTIELSLLGDPSRFSNLRTSDTAVTLLSQSEGVYQIRVSLSGQTVLPNTKIATLTYDGPSREISIVDTTFVTQAGIRYNLSNSFE